jgi:oxalate decarboxylase/phosphoglucose isomerase-like protein (cupin superfamily)
MSRFLFQRKNQSNPPANEFFRISAANFSALKSLSVQDLDMDPGQLRAPHVHPNANQMDLCISGKGQVGIVGPGGEQHLLDLEEGDAAFIPQGYLHWVENTNTSKSRFILMVSHEEPQTIELSEMNAGVPPSVNKQSP